LLREDDSGFPHQADHILSLKHGGSSDAANLAYACVFCNRHKGSDIASIDPGSGELVPLFNPRADEWRDHFQLEGDYILSRSRTGGATMLLLQLNSPERMAERRLLQDLDRYPSS
jgi:hypothetical protein